MLACCSLSKTKLNNNSSVLFCSVFFCSNSCYCFEWYFLIVNWIIFYVIVFDCCFLFFSCRLTSCCFFQMVNIKFYDSCGKFPMFFSLIYCCFFVLQIAASLAPEWPLCVLLGCYYIRAATIVVFAAPTRTRLHLLSSFLLSSGSSWCWCWCCHLWLVVIRLDGHNTSVMAYFWWLFFIFYYFSVFLLFWIIS